MIFYYKSVGKNLVSYNSFFFFANYPKLDVYNLILKPILSSINGMVGLIAEYIYIYFLYLVSSPCN